MRRFVVSRKNCADSDGNRCPRLGLARKIPRSCSDEPLIDTCAVVLRAPGESKVCSSALTSIAETWEAPQVLPGATSCSPPVAPMPAMSWHCAWPVPGEQDLAAHSDGHNGATSSATIVPRASRIALAGRALDGINSLILSSQATPALSGRQLSSLSLCLSSLPAPASWRGIHGHLSRCLLSLFPRFYSQHSPTFRVT